MCKVCWSCFINMAKFFFPLLHFANLANLKGMWLSPCLYYKCYFYWILVRRRFLQSIKIVNLDRYWYSLGLQRFCRWFCPGKVIFIHIWNWTCWISCWARRGRGFLAHKLSTSGWEIGHGWHGWTTEHWRIKPAYGAFGCELFCSGNITWKLFLKLEFVAKCTLLFYFPCSRY